MSYDGSLNGDRVRHHNGPASIVRGNGCLLNFVAVQQKFYPVHRHIVDGVYLDVDPLIVFHLVYFAIGRVKESHLRGRVVNRHLHGGLLEALVVADSGQLQRVKPLRHVGGIPEL